ncbi:MAG TPA: anhydro-N-acetylmuramic acid kinase [Rubricoccaceae bacterium]|nr:anhydro-N-acetylmuramic acid kinase [Rubricoccaceae bacterium]
MHPIHRLLSRPERLVAGLISGTSLDGVDAGVVRLAGTGRGLRVETLAFVSVPYEDDLREALRACTEVSLSDVRLVSQLHVLLAHRFADVLEVALAKAGMNAEELDLIGSHGQTVHHVPDAEPVQGLAGPAVRSTLQIGSGAVLAARLGVPVVSDFRLADMALGGQGAPLAPYLDDVLFAHATETRGLLNLGGIGNLSVLPVGGGPADTFAFDTGPSNVLLDALTQRLFRRPYDADGALAARGTPDESLIEKLLSDPYFAQPPPKSTGRELFNAAYVDRFVADGPADPHDLLATAAELTARSVHDAYQRFVEPNHRLDRLIASGGGVHNAYLMRRLAERFAPVPVETTAAYGLDPDAKEAVLFAVLAHEWANGVRTGLPAVTGATRPAFQGTLALP